MQAASFDLGVGLFNISLGTAFLNEIATYMTQTSGATVDSLYSIVLSSSVGQNSAYYPNYLTNAQFAGRLATNLLGTKGGVVSAESWQAGADWAQAALDGGMSRAAVAKMAVEAVAAIPATDASYGAAAATFNNKVAVSEYYTLVKAASSTDLNTLTNVLKNVTSTTDVSSDTALNTVITQAGGASTTTGKSFSLTTGIDSGASFTGADNDDTFSAVINNATTPTTTLNAGDSLVGGAGTDTLSIVVQDNTAAGVSGFFTSGIENINIQVADTAGETFDFAGVSGASAVTSLNSGGALTVNNVQSNLKTVVQGANASVAVNYANTLVAGSADTAEIEINGAATTASITIDVDGQSAGGFETVNVKSTGTASGSSTASTTVTIGDAAANTIKALNVSGDAAARITTTLDGAASTSSTTVGKVTITNTAGADVTMTGVGGNFVSVTGGAGNDTIRVNALTSDSTISGGEGTDTLSVASTGALASTAFKNVSGFEKIQLAGSLTATQDLTSAGAVTDVILSAALGGGTLSGVASGLNLQLTGTGGTNATVSLTNAATSTSDVLNVTVGNTTTLTSNLAVGTLNVGNIETVNLTSSSKEEVTAGNHTITLASASALKELTVKGNESVVVTTTGSTELKTVNASAATSHVDLRNVTVNATTVSITGGSGNDSMTGGAGNDSLVGNAGNDLITGGAGNDVVEGGDGNDTLISGGAGNDKFDGGAGDDRIVFAAGELTSNDTVTGGDGTNTLVFSNTLSGNALADSAFKNVTGITTLTAAANAVTATANDGADNTTGTLEFTLNSSAQAAGITTVAAQFNATTGATTGTNAIKATVQEGFTNALTFKIGDTGSNDNIAAGATTASITVSGNDTAFNSGDTFTGGSGASDKLQIKANNGTANLSGMTGFETVEVLAGTTATNTSGLTIGSAAVLTSGKSLTVNASGLTNDSANFTFNGTAETDDGSNTGRFNVTSGSGADNITGGAGNDTVTAGAGADNITAGAGADSVSGEAGNDIINGGTGNDTIDGGTGNDVITGGAGTDRLTGGEGNDTFAYSAQSESAMGDSATWTGDTIVGFNAGDGTSAGVVDKLSIPAGLTVSTITTVTVSSANLATFGTDLAANGNLTTALASAGNVAVITVSSGTAAGTYLAVASTAGSYSSSKTLIVKLEDATNLGNLSTNNFATGTANVTATYSGTTFTISGAASGVVDVTTAGVVKEGSATVTNTGTFANTVQTITLAGVTGDIGATVGITGATLTALASTTGTSGNDTFTLATEVFGAAGSTINGGNGTDTLVFTTYGSDTVGDTGAGISSIENIKLTAGATSLTMDNAVTSVVALSNEHATAAATIVLGSGAAHTYTSGSTGIDTVTLGLTGQTATFTESASNNVIKGAVAGSTVTTSNTGGNTLTIQSAAGNATAALDTLKANYTGASGTDVLTMIANATSTGNAAITTGTLTSIETLNLGAVAGGAVDVTITSPTSSLRTITGDTTAQNITLQMTAAQLDALTTITSAAVGNNFIVKTTDTSAVTVTLSDTTLTTVANLDGFNFSASAANKVTVNLGASQAAAAVTFTAGTNTDDTINVTGDLGSAQLTTAAFEKINFTASQTGATLSNTSVLQTVTANAGGVFVLSAGSGDGGSFAGSGTATYNVTGGSNGDTIGISSSGNATISGAGGADTINVTGTGLTTITGGAGIDTINLNSSNAVKDIIVFSDGAGTTGITAVADRDTIAGFNKLHDVIQLDSDQTTVAYTAVQVVGATGNATIGTGQQSVTIFNYDLGGGVNVVGNSTDGSALLANMGGAITVTSADAGYIVAYDAGNAYIYRYTETANTSLSAGEIFLIATLTGVTVNDLGSANFTEAA